MLIRTYRVRGHLAANLDPLGLRSSAVRRPDTEYHGFSDADIDRQSSSVRCWGSRRRAARDRRHPARNYCGNVGLEYMHIAESRTPALQERIEGPEKVIQFTKEGKRAILR